MKTNNYSFKKALPVWEVGTEKMMNRSLVFTANVGRGEYTLSLAGSSAFLVLVNGSFLAFGPARAGHGYYRVDEYALGNLLTADENTVEIRMFGYNVPSFEYVDLPSFLCAEITCGDEVIAYTSADDTGFACSSFDERMTKVQRYSYQRMFVENYILDNNYLDYSNRARFKVAVTEPKNFICRDLPYGEYKSLFPISVMGQGSVGYSEKEHYFIDRAITFVGNGTYKGYKPDEFEYFSNKEIGKMDFAPLGEYNGSVSDIHLAADTYVLADMGKNHVGLFEFELDVNEDAEFFIIFDEILVDGNLSPFRIDSSSIFTCIAKKGRYKVLSAEPYVMRYLKLICKGGDVTVRDFKLVEVAFPESEIKAKFVSDDKVMEKIYDAAVLTFRNNTTDIYMDCPSRERAGWLCDSFFTSRVEYDLTGKSMVEKQFLANFIMPEKFTDVPEGMLPMCYPSNQHDGLFIPNWAMWYGIELKEYLGRSGDTEFIAEAKERMYALYNYFKGFENEFGLLENLESWVFVEWSKANDLVQDVSFASNMVYAEFLDCLGSLYSDSGLTSKAKKLRETINSMAMTESGFYCDNAIRSDGKLILSGERTETCQYYAFFFDCATPESHPWLWETMTRDFGYDRAKTGLFPEIYPANAFIGNYLRLDLLDRYGLKDTLYDDIKGYFEYMADRTGTLWEHVSTTASCNHGFASHVIHWMKSIGIVE